MLYVIDDDGRPCRVGYALGNEFADHVLERQNYLYLAHSKLRQCAFGPELLLGELPADVRGTIGVVRGGERTLWQAEFISGEANMSHTLAEPRAPPLQVPGCSAARATCTSTSSAPRCSASPPASRPRRATCSRSTCRPFGDAAAQPARARAPTRAWSGCSNFSQRPSGNEP